MKEGIDDATRRREEEIVVQEAERLLTGPVKGRWIRVGPWSNTLGDRPTLWFHLCERLPSKQEQEDPTFRFLTDEEAAQLFSLLGIQEPDGSM